MITKEAPQLALPVETEDLVRQLIKQADEHHIETNLKIQMIYDMQKSFSDQQVSMVLKLRKELEELKLQMSPNDVAIRKQLVKATNLSASLGFFGAGRGPRSGGGRGGAGPGGGGG